MNWFRRHLNWTLVLAISLGYGIAFGVAYGLNIADENFKEIGGFIVFSVTLPAVIWVIGQKGRSFWWLLLGFVPGAIGVIILLFLENKKGGKAT